MFLLVFLLYFFTMFPVKSVQQSPKVLLSRGCSVQFASSPHPCLVVRSHHLSSDDKRNDVSPRRSPAQNTHPGIKNISLHMYKPIYVVIFATTSTPAFSLSRRHKIVAAFTPYPRMLSSISHLFSLAYAFLYIEPLSTVVRLASARLPAATRTLAAPARALSEAAAPPASPDVVIPECVDSLEWVLDCPPTLHQFDEPPIVVEIAHLMN